MELKIAPQFFGFEQLVLTVILTDHTWGHSRIPIDLIAVGSSMRAFHVSTHGEMGHMVVTVLGMVAQTGAGL